MNKRFLACSLVLLIVTTSGCLGFLEEDEDTISVGTEAIGLKELSVTPDSIIAGSTTTAILRVENTGQLDATINVNSESKNGLEGKPFGDRILTNRCKDIFSVEDFEIRGPSESYRKESSYKLPSNTQIAFTWVLNNSESSEVPLTGFNCNLRFQIPFNYSVRSFRDIQIVKSRETQGTPNLQSKSSPGPMLLSIDLVGSTAGKRSTFIEGDNAEAFIQLKNLAKEGTDYTGFIRTDVPDIESDRVDLQNCDDPGEKIQMFEGESELIRCDINYSLNDLSSKRAEISASTNYTYVQKLGERTVEVKYRGN